MVKRIRQYRVLGYYQDGIDPVLDEWISAENEQEAMGVIDKKLAKFPICRRVKIIEEKRTEEGGW